MTPVNGLTTEEMLPPLRQKAKQDKEVYRER